MSNNTHFSLRIVDVIQESSVARSFLLESPKQLDVTPGQFMMVWVPGQSEKNIHISYDGPYERRIGITVKKRAPKPAICEVCNSCGVCEQVFEMKKGDTIRMRGPYGSGFRLQGQNLLLIGYETRAGPLALLAERAQSMNRDVTAVIAAPSDNRLPFIQRFRASGVDTVTVTDANSTKKSRPMETEVKSLIERKGRFDAAYLWALEKTSKSLLEIMRGSDIPTQVMVERHIHCGIGICGECSIDPTGRRACVEGPVFSDRELENSEYGKYRRHSLRKFEVREGDDEE